ncbi:hypothetical protein [Marinilactibacillus psychrotolerans]|uniref:hypothetical protein n=1 Tax=Marinilactibacillus psychrotolerans TaxID=191770 RepID=UPI003889CEEB
MNAQKAIKIIDKTDPDLLTEEYHEALSIVLESAKDFHKLIGLGKPWSFRDLYIPFIKYETMFSYTLTDLKGIGIEEGEDE